MVRRCRRQAARGQSPRPDHCRPLVNAAPEAIAKAALLAVHKGLSEAESHALNARLILILVNHIGDPASLAQAFDLARNTT